MPSNSEFLPRFVRRPDSRPIEDLRECEWMEKKIAHAFRRVDAITSMTSILQEVPMRIAALAILTTTAVLITTPTPAQTYSPDYPVCMYAYRWGGSDIDCAYSTLAQCAMSASGRGAQCVINPHFANSQVLREPHYRRHRRVL
jgi:uncharacterized protein DUF3551